MSTHAQQSGVDLHRPGYVQSADPGAVGAGKLWIDTSGGAGAWAAKVRNVADTGWETISASVTGLITVIVPDYHDTGENEGIAFETTRTGGPDAGKVRRTIIIGDADGFFGSFMNLHYTGGAWHLYDTARDGSGLGQDSQGRLTYYYQQGGIAVDPDTLWVVAPYPKIESVDGVLTRSNHAGVQAPTTGGTLYLIGKGLGFMARAKADGSTQSGWDANIRPICYADTEPAGNVADNNWTGTFYPAGNVRNDNTTPVDISLGRASAGNRWAQLHANTGTIETSDERIKDWRGGLNEAELRVAKRLAGLIGIYQFKADVSAKGADTARLHTGVIAQRVIEAFEAEGLDAMRYGLVCHDEWDEHTEHAGSDGDGEPLPDRVIPAGDLFSIRYEEAACFVIAGQAQHLAELEARLAALGG